MIHVTLPSLQEDEKLLSPKDTISIILRKIKKPFAADILQKLEIKLNCSDDSYNCYDVIKPYGIFPNSKKIS